MTYNWLLNYFMTLDCPKSKKCAPTQKKVPLFQIYAYYKFFEEFQFHAKMLIQRNNKETLQFLKQIEWKKMSHTTLADEVTCFFGAVKTKRSNTVKSKIAYYVKKDQLRKLIFFQNLQGKWWSGQGNKIVLE